MRRLQELLDIELPIIHAPMAGSQGSRLALAVSEAGGLGSLPCAALSLDAMRAELVATSAEGRGSGEFSPLWAGQNTGGCREAPAHEVTHALAAGL